MVDFNKELVSALETILPTYYEMVLTSKIATPCISYLELNNAATDTGDTLGYSRISYQIKVWGNRLSELQAAAQEIDMKLKPLGFKRISSGELFDKSTTMIQKILTYECLALENFE